MKISMWSCKGLSRFSAIPKIGSYHTFIIIITNIFRFKRYFNQGDYFGESVLGQQLKRVASAKAKYPINIFQISSSPDADQLLRIQFYFRTGFQDPPPAAESENF